MSAPYPCLRDEILCGQISVPKPVSIAFGASQRCSLWTVADFHWALAASLLSSCNALLPAITKMRWESRLPKHYLTVAQRREFAARNLARIVEHFGHDAPVGLIPSNMKAGPLPRMPRSSSEGLDIRDRPLPPLEGCTHPDQCACVYSVNVNGIFGG